MSLAMLEAYLLVMISSRTESTDTLSKGLQPSHDHIVDASKNLEGIGKLIILGVGSVVVNRQMAATTTLPRQMPRVYVKSNQGAS